MLAVATVIIGLWTRQRREGLIHETKIPMQELKPKVQGAYRQGGRNCGILWYYDMSCLATMNQFPKMEVTSSLSVKVHVVCMHC